MILQAMTPQEKHGQMFALMRYIYSIPMAKREQIFKRVAKTKVFPSFLTADEDVPGMGVWTIIYEAESKSNIRKGIITLRAYQKFHVSHSKNPLNNGTGIYLFNGDDSGRVMCHEFPPHYFNRLRERLIEPKGIVQPDFHRLVKAMLRLHHLSMDTIVRGYNFKRGSDGMYSMERDNGIDRKDGYDNFISYHKEGVSLGVSVGNKDYVNFTTFVPNSLLREGQKEMQQKMIAELRQHEYHQQLNPFATFNRREFIDKDKDI